jgi:hypothetical protein
MTGVMAGSEGSPQPRFRRPGVDAVEGQARRRAANDRQRKAAAAEAEYERWRLAMVEQNWQ